MSDLFNKLFFSFVLLFGGFCSASGQTKDLLPEASRELITKIESDRFTFVLERFIDDGVPNLSMSKGFEFIRIGSDLESILNALWPKLNFIISPEVQKYNYHLMLQHLDQKRTDEFMDVVLESYLDESGFNIRQSKEVQHQNCVEVDSPDSISDHQFVPDNGVIRSTTFNRDTLILSGFTLEEILAEISNISGSIFSLYDYDHSSQTYEMTINVKNLESIKASLVRYGLYSRECEREVEVIYIDRLPNY